MINIVALTGRLTATPELKKTPNGASVTSFALAIQRRHTKDGERITDFIDCVAWQNNAEFITHFFSKGDTIEITGEMQTRTYTDKNGNNRKITEVVVNDASFSGGKKQKSASEDGEEYIEI